MSKIKDGGPAFPSMSLRDYFAAQAMIALHCSETRGGTWRDGSATHCAKNAYALADAMLKAREVKP